MKFTMFHNGIGVYDISNKLLTKLQNLSIVNDIGSNVYFVHEDNLQILATAVNKSVQVIIDNAIYNDYDGHTLSLFEETEFYQFLNFFQRRKLFRVARYYYAVNNIKYPTNQEPEQQQKYINDIINMM